MQNPASTQATNSIVTLNGRTVQARIDPTLPVEEVVKQLCFNLKVKEPPSHFVIRDTMGEQVTDDNLRIKIENHADLKLEPKNA
ncbi:hypothetical protein GALMADRAFT_222251 [Galerina marginata CBS 339.88]|uniref:Ubiquitin-like domain-containing protein n=1 Tax=Galerina marginata (strain CBS 339.88) TaxID=685588 RepID=A0A067TNV7_GALM3|nr:hypothetical protein GALMADRAFT_222251 [Galerina marginata CBS 339.88]